jgi:N-acetyl-anhydromuramyl-L-alanine amidase AmpD
MNVQWRPSPNCSSAARRRGGVRGLVLHDTECNLAAALTTFATPNSVSAHYVIDRDGAVYQCVHDEDVAYHVAAFGANGALNRNRPSWLRWPDDYEAAGRRYSATNAVTIGIELVGFASEGYTPEQYAMLGALCGELCQRWGLSPTLLPDAGADATIVTHGWLQTDRVDPGPHFDWAALRAALAVPAPAPEGDPGEQQETRPERREEEQMAQSALTDDQRRILERMAGLHANADSIVEWINTIGALQQANAELTRQLQQLQEQSLVRERKIARVTITYDDGTQSVVGSQ